MTYQRKAIAPFKIDVIKVDDSASFDGSYNWLGISGSIVNTNASISSNELTLPAGSHWRVTFSGGQRYATGAYPGAATTIGFYDPNTSSFVGIKGNCTGFNALKRGRSEACALILNSDITTSLTLRCYYGIPTSGTWSRNTISLYRNLSLVIMELPA